MDIANLHAYRHALTARRSRGLAVLALCMVGLLASVALLLTAGSGGPTPDPGLLGPFRWEHDALTGRAGTLLGA